jgi:secreted Zn-dependent insulinase-like peptidase
VRPAGGARCSRALVLTQGGLGSLLAHMLGHEAAGSILSYLKAKCWANQLTAGPSEVGAIACVCVAVTATPSDS